MRSHRGVPFLMFGIIKSSDMANRGDCPAAKGNEKRGGANRLVYGVGIDDFKEEIDFAGGNIGERAGIGLR